VTRDDIPLLNNQTIDAYHTRRTQRGALRAYEQHSTGRLSCGTTIGTSTIQMGTASRKDAPHAHIRPAVPRRNRRTAIAGWGALLLFSHLAVPAQMTYTYTGQPFSSDVLCGVAPFLNSCSWGPLEITASFNSLPTDFSGTAQPTLLTLSVKGFDQTFTAVPPSTNEYGSPETIFVFSNGQIVNWGVYAIFNGVNGATPPTPDGCGQMIINSWNGYTIGGGQLPGYIVDTVQIDGAEISYDNCAYTAFYAAVNNGYAARWTLATTLVVASTLPPGQAGAPYGPAPLISGGTPPYIVNGNGIITGIGGLPAGLIVDPLTGNVVGNPLNPSPGITSQVTGAYSITGSVADATGAIATVPAGLTLTVYCGNPNSRWADQDAVNNGAAITSGMGDSRDALIQEHIATGENLYYGAATQGVPQANYSGPHCTDFTQANAITPIYDNLYLLGSKGQGSEPDYSDLFSWMIIRSPVVDAASLGPEYGIGIQAWRAYIQAAGDTQFRQVNSSYRNPYRNANTTAASGQSAATHSQHILGNAIDLQNIAGTGIAPIVCSSTNSSAPACQERTMLVATAIQAGSQYVEPAGSFCKSSCVHAVWTSGPYRGGNTPNAGTGYPGLYVNP
jgi:hypothetical protein